MKKFEILKDRYQNLRDKLHLKQAKDNLATLINLRNEFDTSFDSFFDRKELREKYEINYQNAWDTTTNEPNFDVTQTDIESNFLEEDEKEYEKFLQHLIDEIHEELRRI